MPALVERMAGVGAQGWAPWWVGDESGEFVHLGGEAVTAKEMQEAAGLTWLVKPVPLYTRHEGRYVKIPDRFSVSRQDTGASLGLVSSRYEPVQNHECFNFFDEIVGEGRAVYHTAGSLQGGRKTWILAKLPESITVAGEQQIDNYLLLANAHDGTFAFRFLWTPINVVCYNTLNFALSGSKDGYRLSHFQSIRRRMDVQDAREAVCLAERAINDLAVEGDKLAQSAVDDEYITGFLQRLFPLPTTKLLAAPTDAPMLLLPEPKREDLMPEFKALFLKRDVTEELIRTGKGNSGKTRWDCFNGTVEFADYCMGWDKNRSYSLLFGDGQHLKRNAWNLLQKKTIAS